MITWQWWNFCFMIVCNSGVYRRVNYSQFYLRHGYQLFIFISVSLPWYKCKFVVVQISNFYFQCATRIMLKWIKNFYFILFTQNYSKLLMIKVNVEIAFCWLTVSSAVLTYRVEWIILIVVQVRVMIACEYCRYLINLKFAILSWRKTNSNLNVVLRLCAFSDLEL